MDFPVVGVVDGTGEPVHHCDECNLNLAGPKAAREHWWWHKDRLLRARLSAPAICPYCGRVMSHREHAEQGACNDCYGGAH